jgi:glycosyltransferase involved in cell wall biosynthesis
MIRASIVVATYNRMEPLACLLATLARQTVPRGEYEVVVVDDGSREDVTPLAARFIPSLQMSVLRQTNSGVAVARQRGVEHARGRIVIFLDDDMLAAEDFVAQHIAAHEGHDDRVVMGELLPDSKIRDMPLFERYHAYQLEKAAERYFSTGTFSGRDVYTGNLSLPRELFLRAGGFDPTFHIEDTELGVRLEQLGATFVFSREVATVHASDHTSLDAWLARSVKDGRDWVHLARKHRAAPNVSPWRFFLDANPISRVVFATVVLAPRLAPTLARLVFYGASRADAFGLERGMLSAMTLLYGIQYFNGVRVETGSLGEAIEDYRACKRGEANGTRLHEPATRLESRFDRSSHRFPGAAARM